MDNKFYRTPQYHKMVWQESKKEARIYIGLDRRVLSGNIVLAVITGFTTSRILDYWSSAVEIPSIFQFIAILLGTVIGFIGLYAYHLVLGVFWFVPARLYREMETEAWKFTWKDIEIKPFRFPPTSGFGIGLEVISDKNRNQFSGTSMEFSIEIRKLLLEEFGTGLNLINPRREMSLLATDLVRFHPTTTIQNRRDAENKENWIKHIVIPLANWDESRAWIVLRDGNKDLFLEKDIPYSVVIDFNEWIMQDVSQQWGCAVWCNLKYYKNEKGEMEVDLKIVKRNPEYEKR